jgi:phosphoenolpyruvate synthase/pyruvate phosphate dikinase
MTGRTLDEVIAALPEERLRRVEARAEQIRAAYRHAGLTKDLSDEWIEAIKNAKMSPEHDHLNALMDEQDS